VKSAEKKRGKWRESGKRDLKEYRIRFSRRVWRQVFSRGEGRSFERLAGEAVQGTGDSENLPEIASLSKKRGGKAGVKQKRGESHLQQLLRQYVKGVRKGEMAAPNTVRNLREKKYTNFSRASGEHPSRSRGTGKHGEVLGTGTTKRAKRGRRLPLLPGGKKMERGCGWEVH